MKAIKFKFGDKSIEAKLQSKVDKKVLYGYAKKSVEKDGKPLFRGILCPDGIVLTRDEISSTYIDPEGSPVEDIATELDGVLDEVCAQRVDRVTFPFEACADDAAVAAAADRIRSSGARAWLAVAPATDLAAVRPCFAMVDGILVMLIEPGTTDAADPALPARAGDIGPRLPAGVDGGVNQTNLGACLAAGARYIVSGRALLSPEQPQRRAR